MVDVLFFCTSPAEAEPYSAIHEHLEVTVYMLKWPNLYCKLSSVNEDPNMKTDSSPNQHVLRGSCQLKDENKNTL